MSASARGLPAHAHSFSVQQVVDAYAEALRGLSRDALIFEDLHQVIQVEVDLNADQTLSLYETYCGLGRLVRGRHWYDKLADGLWRRSASGRD